MNVEDLLILLPPNDQIHPPLHRMGVIVVVDGKAYDIDSVEKVGSGIKIVAS